MRRIILLSILLLAAVAGVTAQAKSPTDPNEEKVFIIDDSLKLAGWLMRDTLVSNEPLVILLHQLGLTHESYQAFTDALQKFVMTDSLKRPMPTILSFDLRGHGKSVQRGKEILNAATMKQSEFLKMPGDIRQAVNATLNDPSLGVDTNNIIVIGASIGANTAAMLTEMLPGVKKVALLSPGKSYRGLEPGKAVAKFGGSILIMASKGDIYSTSSTEYLDSLNRAHTTVQWFGGENHGTEIVTEDRAAMNDLVDWVMKK